MATEKQINFINKLIERKGMHTSWTIISRFKVSEVEELSSGQASYVIGMLLEEPDFNEKAFLAAQQSGLNRYEKLVAWAKEQGVKGVRSRMKTTTLMNLIEDAGLTPPAELVRG